MCQAIQFKLAGMVTEIELEVSLQKLMIEANEDYYLQKANRKNMP